MIGTAWKSVQDYFTAEVFDKDLGNYFLEKRKAKKADQKNLSPFEGWVDWPVINALYNTWLNRLLFRSRGNVLCCTPATDLSRDNDSEAIVSLYGPYSIKPEGQKSLSFQFSTILATERKKNGQWVLTTIKDRERKELVKAPMSDFTETYLLDVAQWSI
jgi:hypothetical protein